METYSLVPVGQASPQTEALRTSAATISGGRTKRNAAVRNRFVMLSCAFSDSWHTDANKAVSIAVNTVASRHT